MSQRSFDAGDMLVSGSTLGELIEQHPDDGIFLSRALINEIHAMANQGWQLALRRVSVESGKYATHHEDYLPLFKDISALCINVSSILKRESQLQKEQA